jgi:NADH:ubiquinone oxidoreductase subunit E
MMDEILARYAPSQKELISILHDVQAEYGYVPREAVAAIFRFLSLSEGEVFGVLTFYRGFCREPRGKFLITVCLGTACHVRGGATVILAMGDGRAAAAEMDAYLKKP